MTQKDIAALSSLLSQTKDRYQLVSRKIHWTSSDSEQLDDLMISHALQEDIGKRIVRITRLEITKQIVPQFIQYKAWERTKAVYSFSNELVEDVARTADTQLRVSLLTKLPFRDMLFFFPGSVLSKPKDEETAGIFVHIEKHTEVLWAIFNFFDRKQNDDLNVHPGLQVAFPLTDGMKISHVFQTPQYLSWLKTYKTIMAFDRKLNEQEAEERLLSDKKALNAAVNLLYYLAAENADIKPVKSHKKSHKSSPSAKDVTPPAINLHEVGSEYAEIVYRKFKAAKSTITDDTGLNEIEYGCNDEETEQAGKRQNKRRPHVRRAHWQHYWTGEGRSIQVLRWKSDLFVGVNSEDQAVVVYEVPGEKETLKGKRNPNTSKK